MTVGSHDSCCPQKLLYDARCMQSAHSRFPYAHWLLPTVLAASLYLINLPGTWIYDDLYIAHDDQRLQHVNRWHEYLTTDYFAGAVDNLWRPLTSISYAVEWWLHGERAWPFHLVNLLLHAAVTLLVAKLGRRLTGSRSVGFIAGLLFAAHPIHVEAVTGIVGRAEEMCTLGVLGGLLLFIGRAMTVRRAFAVTGCFLFAALSKEQGVFLPFMLLGWTFLRRAAVLPSPHVDTVESAPDDKPTPHSAQANANLLLTALLTGTLAVYISYRNSIAPWYWEKAFLDWMMNPLVDSVGVDRWLIPMAILGRYAALLIAPWRLAPDYSAVVFTSVQRLDDPFLWLGAVTVIFFLMACISAFLRRNGAALFCLGALALTYFLAGNLIMIGTIFGERLMYQPSVFVCVLAAMGMAKLPSKACQVSLTILLIAFCIRTETYAWRWNDRVRLYSYTVQVQPKSSMGYLLLGDELQTRHGDLEGAERAFADGRVAAPDAWRLWESSAELALLRGHLVDAEAWANRAFKLHPSLQTSTLSAKIAESRRP